MLFGRANPKNEEVGLAELETLLNRCFDQKLRRLSAKAPAAERELLNLLSSFNSSVEKFSKAEGKPDMEYLYGIKEGFLASQKPIYSNTLMRIAAKVGKEYEAINIYYRSDNLLKGFGAFTNEVLTANSSFRAVMLGYAKELNNTKSIFSRMEKICKELKSDIDSSTIEFSEYKALRAKINAITADLSMIGALKYSIGSAPATSESEDDNTPKLIAEAALKEKELQAARAKHKNTESELVHLLLPIERAARKHDHISLSKKKISDYLTDPFKTLKGDNEVTELRNQLTELKKEIINGSVDVKNKEDAIAMIDKIMQTDLSSLIALGRKEAADTHELEREMNRIHVLVKEKEEIKKRADSRLRDKTEAEEELKGISESLNNKKEEIERLFMNYYGKRINLILTPN